MERHPTGWRRIERVQATCTARDPLPGVKPDPSETHPHVVDVQGFRRLQLNGRFTQRVEMVVQGKPSFWDTTSRFIIYWQGALKRWAICGNQELDAVRKGQFPACACSLDS